MQFVTRVAWLRPRDRPPWRGRAGGQHVERDRAIRVADGGRRAGRRAVPAARRHLRLHGLHGRRRAGARGRLQRGHPGRLRRARCPPGRRHRGPGARLRPRQARGRRRLRRRAGGESRRPGRAGPREARGDVPGVHRRSHAGHPLERPPLHGLPRRRPPRPQGGAPSGSRGAPGGRVRQRPARPGRDGRAPIAQEHHPRADRLPPLPVPDRRRGDRARTVPGRPRAPRGVPGRGTDRGPHRGARRTGARGRFEPRPPDST